VHPRRVALRVDAPRPLAALVPPQGTQAVRRRRGSAGGAAPRVLHVLALLADHAWRQGAVGVLHDHPAARQADRSDLEV
jgi:hypothetical protein